MSQHTEACSSRPTTIGCLVAAVFGTGLESQAPFLTLRRGSHSHTQIELPAQTPNPHFLHLQHMLSAIHPCCICRTRKLMPCSNKCTSMDGKHMPGCRVSPQQATIWNAIAPACRLNYITSHAPHNKPVGTLIRRLRKQHWLQPAGCSTRRHPTSHS